MDAGRQLTLSTLVAAGQDAERGGRSSRDREKLKGDRANTYSIRVNDQWRICFRWTNAGREDVEIVDYH